MVQVSKEMRMDEFKDGFNSKFKIKIKIKIFIFFN